MKSLPGRTDSEAAKNATLLGKYNISLGVYEEMLKLQGGLCAICREPETTKLRGTVKCLCVDHDHKTGEVRALLCAKCNLMLGAARDNAAILSRAVDYLAMHSPQERKSRIFPGLDTGRVKF